MREASEAFDCDDVLDAFLHDMSVLDQAQPRPTKSYAATKDVSTPLPVVVVQSPEPSKKKRQNPSWFKRKRELEALRAQSEALETRREFLLLKRAKVQQVDASETLTQQKQQKQQKEALALVKQKCEAAQGDNGYLKKRLRAYVDLSGALQTALSAAEQELATMSMAVARALRTEIGSGYQLRFASPSLFDMLEERVNVKFNELEASFRTNQRQMTSADTELVQVYYKNGVGTVEFKRAQLLPFEEAAISATIFSIVEVGAFADGQDSRVVRRSEDTFAMDSRLTVCLNDGGTVNLNAHSVMKRFLTPTGIVMMLESISDWTAGVKNSGAWTHTTEEGGYFVISNYAIDGVRAASNVSPGVSQLRSELTLKPGDPSKSPSHFQLAEARTINAVVIPSFRDIIQSRHQFLENTLFDCIRETGTVGVGA
ncbi:hypothetical protein PR003_g28180 [Phytophthora rubi]|uniref:Uncharacterized protein n=1 Tax=Phytophthora rubi TaxID=129364 RepID=A0A6A3HP94_9STRA|nr:hypothetical protein PR002_g27026 [Phytophthora rubi]KAE8970802.1 hypothetical protein PR001_g27095 [Phytophthora rubi]KAE9279637.1 hypothetical protein PR003_g28180 [Phytophthora rubi]